MKWIIQIDHNTDKNLWPPSWYLLKMSLANWFTSLRWPPDHHQAQILVLLRGDGDEMAPEHERLGREHRPKWLADKSSPSSGWTLHHLHEVDQRCSRTACRLQRYAAKDINHYNNAEKNSMSFANIRCKRYQTIITMPRRIAYPNVENGLEIRITETRGWLNYLVQIITARGRSENGEWTTTGDLASK